MSQTNKTSRSFFWRLFHFLGTMKLAITLLITLAIASVTGTVLQQNQPYPDYVIKFGPFWFDVFEKMGLYDVYSAIWFLLVLLLLVLSTSVCLIRHTPSMVKEMFNLRSHVQIKSLKAMRHQAEWMTVDDISATAENVQRFLTKKGFRTRKTDQPEQDAVLISAMRGGLNRLGYILTHGAIVMICLGGLLDSNLALKIAEWRGQIKIETENKPLSEIDKASRLPVGNRAFRGSITIAEGRAMQVVYLPMRDGYLVQQLPFTIELKDFRVEHYATGMPKSFESDLLIHDPELQAPLKKTISVNHPLIYKDYAIYQASFGDGGSELFIEAWPLFANQQDVVELKMKVFESRTMRWGDRELKLEMTEFRPFNINPDPDATDPDHLRDFGPSIGFKLRKETGEALEYQNYMNPVERDGQDFYLSGVRDSPAEPFGFLYIPADEDGSLDGFMQFLHRLQDRELISQLATEIKNETLAEIQAEQDDKLADSLQKTLEMLVKMFVEGGFNAVHQFIDETLPKAERESLGPVYLALLTEMLGRIYFSEFAAGQQLSEKELVFLQDAVEVIGSLPNYASPVFLNLTDYNHIEATGLQIARTPGKKVVYLGCAFLITGVFLLFYLPQRRIWLWLSRQGGQTQVVLAGMSNRIVRDFDTFFAQISADLKSEL